jgi:ATP adenylyltransferase
VVYCRPMTEHRQSGERRRNLWAPWRIQYIDGLHGGDDEGECFFCRDAGDVGNDRKNLVLWRGKHCLAVMNRFPYTGGHALVAPYDHVGGLEDLDDATMLELMCMARDMQKLLAECIHAEGFNVGLNIGRCAGAGLPGHLHVHVVPRWGGDTNFMAVLGDVHTVPQALDDLYDRLVEASARLRLPRG